MKGGYEYIDETATSPYLKIAMYLVAFVAFVVLALTIVHYTVYPIWKLSPTDKGVITLPGFDSTYVAWKTAGEHLADINSVNTPVASGCVNWSGTLDVIIDDPTAVKGWNDSGPSIERILFWRGRQIDPNTVVTGASTLMTLIPSYNVCIYMDKLTNDIFFSVMCKKSETENVMENVTIPNFPVRKTMRIGWMISEKFYEVYVNGTLVQSKKLSNPPLTTVATSDDATFRTYIPGGLRAGRVQNLQLWGSPLSSAQFRALGTPTEFLPWTPSSPAPPATSCR